MPRLGRGQSVAQFGLHLLPGLLRLSLGFPGNKLLSLSLTLLFSRSLSLRRIIPPTHLLAVFVGLGQVSGLLLQALLELLELLGHARGQQELVLVVVGEVG